MRHYILPCGVSVGMLTAYGHCVGYYRVVSPSKMKAAPGFALASPPRSHIKAAPASEPGLLSASAFWYCFGWLDSLSSHLATRLGG